MSVRKVKHRRRNSLDSKHITHRPNTWLSSDQQALSNKLRSDPFIRDAFVRVCRAGFDPDELEAHLIDLPIYPEKRTERLFSLKDLRRLSRIIRDLDRAGKEISQFDSLMYLGCSDGWPVDPLYLSRTLRQIAACMASAKASWFADCSTKANAISQIYYLVETVRRRTGKPHLPALATLIGAMLGKPTFSEDHLKTMISRFKKRRKGKRSRP